MHADDRVWITHRKNRRWVPILLAAYLIVGGMPFPANGSEVSVIARVLKSRGEDPSDSGKLWLKVASGEKTVKKVAVYNPTNSPLKIKLSVSRAVRNGDGTLTLDKGGVFPARDYFQFSKNDFVIPSSGAEVVEFGAAIPEGVRSERIDFYLNVNASNPAAPRRDTKSGIRVVIPVTATYALPGFLGIGDFSDLDYSFNVDKIEGSLNASNLKSVRVFLSNTGTVPQFYEGTVELRSVEFERLGAGPLNFSTKTIPASMTKFVDIQLPQDISVGPYKAFVEVSNGKTFESKVFEFELSFPRPFSFSYAMTLFLLGLVSLIVLLIALDYIKNPRNSIATRALRRVKKRELSLLGNDPQSYVSENYLPVTMENFEIEGPQSIQSSSQETSKGRRVDRGERGVRKSPSTKKRRSSAPSVKANIGKSKKVQVKRRQK